jgi:hypothetical protein
MWAVPKIFHTKLIDDKSLVILGTVRKRSKNKSDPDLAKTSVVAVICVSSGAKCFTVAFEMQLLEIC